MQNTKEPKYNWNLKDIFKTKEEFDKSKTELEEILKDIEKYQGNLNSSQKIYTCYSLYEKALELYEKIYSYGMLKFHLDMSNQESIKLFKEVESIGTEFSKITSFITPEITNIDENTLKEYLFKDEKLDRYKRILEEIIEDKKHILSKEEENLLANYEEVFSSSENTYDTLTNTEFKFGTLVNENGEEVEMTDSTYSLYLKSKNENVRKQAFDLMYNKYSEFVNTITELYLSRVKASTITSRIRKYNSSLEKAVKKDDSSIKVYESLIDAINKNMYINHISYKLLTIQ